MSQLLNANEDEIRLISILPLGPGQSDLTQVECHLHTVSLSDSTFTPAYKRYLIDKNLPGAWNNPRFVSSGPTQGDELCDWIHIDHPSDNATSFLPKFRHEWGDFMALSYTWGDPTNVREIIVNGQPFLIPRNLEACLRVLRRKDYIKDGWQIWVDAICINQENATERANEVKRMREIYTNAWTPIIWLGEGVEDYETGLNLLITLALEYTSRDGINRLTRALHQNPELFGKGVWRALNDIVCCQYWRRLWIMQEATLGRDSTPVLCGERTLPWIYFAATFEIIINTDEVINTYIVNELKVASRSFDLIIWPNLNAVGEIQRFQDLHANGSRPNIYRLVLFSRAALSTNPRDKVYGLLAIMDESLTSLIKPDYSDTVENVYRSFTLDTIRATKSLEALRHCELNEDSLPPSWVPDLLAEFGKAALTIADNAFAASGSSIASIQTFADQSIISCKGIIIDHLDGLGCKRTGGWSTDTIIPSTSRSNPYGTFEGMREAIWKSMVACHRLPSEPLDANYSSLLATPALATIKLPDQHPVKDIVGSGIFKYCVSFLKGNADLRIGGRRMEEYYRNDINANDIDAVHLRDALMQRDRINLGRRLVTTGRGYIGMALETVFRETDFVAVLLGCSTPLILRPSRRCDDGEVRWKIVGECYLHGTMTGEAMEWGIEIQDIVLC
ncbi:hypothetical protein MMC28_007216 [Mycoblastus sanguinarius]|nr:hypothetical protein [Mycoblastus sanguinarius]